MNGLEMLARWITDRPGEATSALGAANELLQRAAPAAARAGVKPLQLFTGIPAADRAIADAAGIAEVVGRWKVAESIVFDALRILKDVALALA